MDQSQQSGQPKRKATPRAVKLAERQRRALELRRGGATLDQIARTLGYKHRSSVHRIIESALEQTLHEDASALRALELDRLDRLQLALWPRAMSGDVKATVAIIRIMAHRAKLLGLYAPQQREVTFRDELAGIAEQVAAEFGMSTEEVLAEAERLLRGGDLNLD